MSFNFTLSIENLGKVEKAKINVKPLTIIAGENSSGKTFVTKSLYAILDTLSTSHFANQLADKHNLLRHTFRRFSYSISNPANIDLDFFGYCEDSFELIISMIETLSEADITEQEAYIKNYLRELEVMDSEFSEYFESRLKYQKFQKIKNLINHFKSSFKSLKKLFEDPTSVISSSITETLLTSIKKNFQIKDTNSLVRNSQSKSAKIDISTVGDMQLDKKLGLKFNFTSTGISEVQKLSNIVFLDSPIYMKIRKALEKKERDGHFMYRQREDENYLKGYPEYVEELYQYANKEYIGTPEFDNISKDIQDAIHGKLTTSSSGELIYQDENENEIPFALTAMGISNIGTIDLLLRNNIIKKGSFLIMDEPEVHLHPEWQVKLANILYELSKNGVNVVIATHSLDFLKAFQVISKKNEEAESIISYNKMPFLEEFSKKSELEKVKEILGDLSRPFYNLYEQGL